MSNKQWPNLYLLANPQGRLIIPNIAIDLPVADFFTVVDKEAETIAIFMSKLDAEICRQVFNHQTNNGKFSKFGLMGEKDQCVSILTKFGELPYSLVTCFAINNQNRNFIIDDENISFTCFAINKENENWILRDHKKPTFDIFANVEYLFHSAGENDYLDELQGIETLEQHLLEEMAKEAIFQIGKLQPGEGTNSVVFSPSRKKWIELKQGGFNG